MTVSLTLLKQQLNIDHDADDDLLAHKVLAAEEWIANFIGIELADLVPTPATITEATLQLAAHWYEQREAAVFGSTGSDIPFGVLSLIRPYRTAYL